jgi:peptide/nickel transport system substrate-binding protein
MFELKRRLALLSFALLGCLTFAPAGHAEKTLKAVVHADLKVLDPTWNTTYITNRYGYVVYDTLFAFNSKFEPKPQMVDRWSVSDDRLIWTFTLRPGLKFHDGGPVGAADCIASLKRWMVHDPMGQQLASHMAEMTVVDPSTFRMQLKEPFALVLETLGRPGTPAYIYPERIAGVPVTEQITQSIGSGPFMMKRDEWRPGSKVVFVKNPDYIPRSEPPDYMSGGKIPKLDRIEWLYIPDANTAMSALMTGEIDYYEMPPLDFIALFKENPDIKVLVADPLGVQQIIRPNSSFPPFNNYKAREALLYLASQEEYNQAVVGNPELYMKFCGAYFMCGSDNESDAGAVHQPDLAKAKALLAEAGYKGEPIVVLQPTDRPQYAATITVMVEKLRSIGVNVDLQSADWSTISIRRAKKDPLDKGGWNLFVTGHGGPDAATPISNLWFNSGCDKANAGWPCDPTLQQMIIDWAQEPDRAKRHAMIDGIQTRAYESVPYVPTGQFFQPIAYRKNVSGLLAAGMPVYWNIDKQ